MDLNEQRRARGLKPLPDTNPVDQKPERGHARGTTTHRTPGQHPELRGIPLVGSGPGVITGTRPGDPAHKLEQAGRDIVKAALTADRIREERMREARRLLGGK